MESWHWLVWPALAIGAVAALFGLDRLGLWLEDRGWLYYRRKKPASSPMSAWVAMQQFIEPGVKHVVEIKDAKRSETEQEAAKERLVAMLVEILMSRPVNVEAVRLYLATAKKLGLDWRALYEQAVQVEFLSRPDGSASLPPPEMVAPLD